MADRAGAAAGYRWTFFLPLATDAVDTFGSRPPPPPLVKLTRFIAFDARFLAVWHGDLVGPTLEDDEDVGDEDLEDLEDLDDTAELGGEEDEPSPVLDETDVEAFTSGVRLRACGIFVVPPRMQPAHDWAVPPILTEADLRAFLSLDQRDLAFLARVADREARIPAGPLRHYSYSWRRKRGRGAFRLVEAPKLRLKNVQRRIARQILSPVPPHPAATAFRSGASIVAHARSHAGRRVVIRIDLAEFFPSISCARVIALFRTLGYPERVAYLLALLTTNVVPREVFRSERARDLDPWLRALLSFRHLPQGAQTSPAIANLCLFHLDRRLTGLARAFDGEYTRYADDLTFSGSDRLARGAETLIALVTAIAVEEGFRVNARKTRIMRAGVRQTVTGLVVNAHPNVNRLEIERLKATLHNCVRYGPETQNRDQHPRFEAFLRGKIGFVSMVNPARGEKLQAIFDRIDWSGAPSRP